MPITRPQPKFKLVREDSCSPAEICTHVSTKQSLSATMKQTPKEGRVTFYPEVFIRETIHINNFSRDEKVASWYGREEFVALKKDMVPVLRLIVSGKYTGDTENLCARGCESRHKEGSRHRKMNKLNGLLSVLDEQLRQERRGHFDCMQLATVYMSANATCRIIANKVGKSDEIAVMEINKESSFSSTKSERKDEFSSSILPSRK